MNKLKGCGTALITPFNKEFKVDYAVFKKLVQRQIEANIHFLVVLGTTGETPCLEDSEKKKLVELTALEVDRKFPIVVGAGANNTKNVIKSVNALEKIADIDAFLVVTPYYNKPTQEGLYHHFRAISEATDKDIVLYNVPGRTGVNLTAETCLRLAELKNINTVKEASGIYPQISEIIKNAPDGFRVLSGNDDETLSLMATGAYGVISVASNIAPKMMRSFLDFLLKGSFIEAKKMHHRLSPLFKNCFIESNPIPVKAGLFQMKLIANVLRPPLYAATENTLLVMRETVMGLE